MSKVATMDNYLDLNGKTISGSEICRIVNLVFEIDLEQALILNTGSLKENSNISSPENKSKAKAIIDTYLNQSKVAITGDSIRKFIAEIFGVNLNAISALEGARISLYSKNQWIVQNNQDLFVVHTSNHDIDAKVYPTSYFKEQTKIEKVPNDLEELLEALGYTYDKREGSCYFSNPSGKAVSDEFKGKTMAAIRKVIQASFSNI